MLAKKVKQSFVVTVVIVAIGLTINVWEQATTGQVNGSIQWLIMPIAIAAILFTYVFAKYAARKNANTKWVGKSLLLIIVLSLALIELATKLWGFTPQGWTF